MTKIAAMCVLLMAAALNKDLRWVRVKDAYQVHMVLENYYQLPLGEYFQPRQSQHTLPPLDTRFTVWCYRQAPEVVADEAAAKAYVLRCPVWE